jgi:hypothetical protein
MRTAGASTRRWTARGAYERLVGAASDELTDRYEVHFYQVGNYYAVFSRLRVVTGAVAAATQRYPMRIFTRGEEAEATDDGVHVMRTCLKGRDLPW